MSSALLPRDRLATPVDSTPMRALPPLPPGLVNHVSTSSDEPGDDAGSVTPSYLVAARQLVGRHKHSAIAFARLAQAEQSAGNTDAAASAAERGLRLAIEDGDASAQLATAQVLLASGRARAAAATLRETSAHRVPSVLLARIAIESGNKDEAGRHLEHADGYEALTLRAWLALEANSYADAISMLRRACKVSGFTPGVLNNLGYAHAALGSLKKATRETQLAQALAPTDRLIAFNLVSYHLGAANHKGAHRALDRLEAIFPYDVEVALVRADVNLRAGERRRAHQVLQRARTSPGWAAAPLVRRAELDANLAFLRWLTKQRDRVATLSAVIDELKRTNYESLGIASLLPALMSRTRDSGEFEELLTHLAERHPRTELTNLELHLAVLHHETDHALALGREWAHSEPLNPVAAAAAVQLLVDLAGEHDEAIQIGLEALSRMPADLMLVNNVAWALALAGQANRARHLLHRLEHCVPTVTLTATDALVAMMEGAIAEGIAGYDRARDGALQNGDIRYARLVELNKILALRHLPRAVLESQGLPVPTAVEVPDDWEGDLSLWLLSHRAEREGLAFSRQST